MTVASIHETVLLYTQEQNILTSQLTTVMGKITRATRNTSDLMLTVNEKRAYYAQKVSDNPNYSDTPEYQIQSRAVEEDYLLQLSEINSWEAELEQEKSALETKIKVVNTYQESWKALLQNNIKKEFTYGGGSTS